MRGTCASSLRQKDQRVEWQVIAIDTHRQLTPTPAMRLCGSGRGRAGGSRYERRTIRPHQCIPYLVVFDDTSAYRDTDGGSPSRWCWESYLLRPTGKPSDTVIIFMHPIGGGADPPMTNALPRAGHHVTRPQQSAAWTAPSSWRRWSRIRRACVRMRQRLGYTTGDPGRCGAAACALA